MLTIREGRPGDIPAIQHVNKLAFGGAQEAQLVDALRKSQAVLLSLVAVQEEQLVGHILYSPVTAGTGESLAVGAGLGPLAVSPTYQRQGIGSQLVESGNQMLCQMACPFIVVLGHPGYYPRFGFQPASCYGIHCEWDVPDDAFLIMVMDSAKMAGVSGLARYHGAFSMFG
jgi:putative acetyltransferase